MYSVARHVNYCKCMENYQFFRHAKSFGGTCAGDSHSRQLCLGMGLSNASTA